MKDRSSIEDRLRGLLCQELDRRLQVASKRLPHHCKNNYSHPLDHRKSVGGEPNPEYNKIAIPGSNLPVVQTIGLCQLGADSPDDWNGVVCEDPIDAQKCPHFDPTQTQVGVYLKYVEDLKTLKLTGEIEALLWVLDEMSPTLPWWKRIWAQYFLGVNYEPLSTDGTRDVAINLLPSRDEVIERSRNQDNPSGTNPHS